MNRDDTRRALDELGNEADELGIADTPAPMRRVRPTA